VIADLAVAELDGRIPVDASGNVDVKAISVLAVFPMPLPTRLWFVIDVRGYTPALGARIRTPSWVGEVIRALRRRQVETDRWG
jgi:hypothetical protein